MPHLYAIFISEENLDLIQFLNDDVRPDKEDLEKYFTFYIGEDARKITRKIVSKEALYAHGQFKLGNVTTIF